MFRKLFFYIAIASLVASCAQGKKATASWRQKCSVNLISTVDEHNSNEQVEVLVQVSTTEGAQAKLEAEGLEVSIATGPLRTYDCFTSRKNVTKNIST